MKKTVFLCILACFTALLVFGCALRPDDKPSSSDESTEPHVHSFETENIPPTCSMNGETVYTCKCGHSYTKRGEDAKGHDYEAEVIAPTCTVQGLTKYTCKVCSQSFSEDHVAATGHNYQKISTVAPTATSQGYNVYQCKNCSLSYNGDFVGQIQETTPPPPPVTDATGFDGCVFLGDSVSDMLEIHNARTGIFGNATFLTETSYSLYNCIKNDYGVTYNGQRMAPEDAIAASGKKKIFIMLGTNDLVWASVDSTVANYKTLIDRIKAKVPDAEIYIQSQTPIYTAKESQSAEGLSNRKINQYNEKLQELCDTYGYAFVDVATPLKDQSGGLSEKYTTDKYVHINAAACEVWQAVVGKHLGL